MNTNPTEAMSVFLIECSSDSHFTAPILLQLQTKCRLTTVHLPCSLKVHPVYQRLSIHFRKTASRYLSSLFPSRADSQLFICQCSTCSTELVSIILYVFSIFCSILSKFCDQHLLQCSTLPSTLLIHIVRNARLVGNSCSISGFIVQKSLVVTLIDCTIGLLSKSVKITRLYQHSTFLFCTSIHPLVLTFLI